METIWLTFQDAVDSETNLESRLLMLDKPFDEAIDHTFHSGSRFTLSDQTGMLLLYLERQEKANKTGIVVLGDDNAVTDVKLCTDFTETVEGILSRRKITLPEEESLEKMIRDLLSWVDRGRTTDKIVL